MPDPAKTLVLLHGMWGGGWYWHGYRQVLEAAGWHCIAPTLPYHDVDPAAPPDPRLGTLGLVDYVTALEREVAAFNERPVIVGHSMGGLLAQMLAARGLARALVLLAPAPPAGILVLRPSVLKAFRSMQFTWGFWRKPMRQTFDEASWSMLHLLPDVEQREVYARFVYESGRAATEIGYWFLDPRRASRVEAARVTCPILVIVGHEDRITPPGIVARVARRYGAHATLKVLPNHAHWLVGEPGWRRIAEEVRDWMEAVPSART